MEDDNSNIRKNVMGSPRNPGEAWVQKWTKGASYLVVRSAVLTVVTPGTLAPKANVWHDQYPY